MCVCVSLNPFIAKSCNYMAKIYQFLTCFLIGVNVALYSGLDLRFKVFFVDCVNPWPFILRNEKMCWRLFSNNFTIWGCFYGHISSLCTLSASLASVIKLTVWKNILSKQDSLFHFFKRIKHHYVGDSNYASISFILNCQWHHVYFHKIPSATSIWWSHCLAI